MLSYLVTTPKFWESIPKDRELVCGRVRFTTQRYVPSDYIIQLYDNKELAVRIVMHTNGFILVRETRHADDAWQYQLLLS